MPRTTSKSPPRKFRGSKTGAIPKRTNISPNNRKSPRARFQKQTSSKSRYPKPKSPKPRSPKPRSLGSRSPKVRSSGSRSPRARSSRSTRSKGQRSPGPGSPKINWQKSRSLKPRPRGADGYLRPGGPGVPNRECGGEEWNRREGAARTSSSSVTTYYVDGVLTHDPGVTKFLSQLFTKGYKTETRVPQRPNPKPQSPTGTYSFVNRQSNTAEKLATLKPEVKTHRGHPHQFAQIYIPKGQTAAMTQPSDYNVGRDAQCGKMPYIVFNNHIENHGHLVLNQEHAPSPNAHGEGSQDMTVEGGSTPLGEDSKHVYQDEQVIQIRTCTEKGKQVTSVDNTENIRKISDQLDYQEVEANEKIPRYEPEGAIMYKTPEGSLDGDRVLAVHEERVHMAYRRASDQSGADSQGANNVRNLHQYQEIGNGGWEPQGALQYTTDGSQDENKFKAETGQVLIAYHRNSVATSNICQLQDVNFGNEPQGATLRYEDPNRDLANKQSPVMGYKRPSGQSTNPNLQQCQQFEFGNEPQDALHDDAFVAVHEQIVEVSIQPQEGEGDEGDEALWYPLAADMYQPYEENEGGEYGSVNQFQEMEDRSQNHTPSSIDDVSEGRVGRAEEGYPLEQSGGSGSGEIDVVNILDEEGNTVQVLRTSSAEGMQVPPAHPPPDTKPQPPGSPLGFNSGNLIPLGGQMEFPSPQMEERIKEFNAHFEDQELSSGQDEKFVYRQEHTIEIRSQINKNADGSQVEGPTITNVQESWNFREEIDES